MSSQHPPDEEPTRSLRSADSREPNPPSTQGENAEITRDSDSSHSARPLDPTLRVDTARFAPPDGSTVSLPDDLTTRGKPTTAALGRTDSRTFGEYELLDEIARGGMGVVFRARQTKLNRLCALKMILSGEFAGADDIQRFHTEAQAAANLQHPGIVPIYEVGEFEGRHFFSMGLIEGSNLQKRIAEGPLKERDAAGIVIEIARAIEYAHQQQVIHRDLKPGNILLDQAGHPKVTDFGLAKRTSDDSSLTNTGQILGTPSYMAPEQASGRIQEISAASDIYALGAILYASVTGRPPFQAAHVIDTLRQVIDQDPVPPRQLNASLSRDLETICLKCLRKTPNQRYASAAELADDLERYLRGEPIHARPITLSERGVKFVRRHPLPTALVSCTGLLLVALAILFGFWWRAAEDRSTALAQLSSQQQQMLAAQRTRLEQANEAARLMREFLNPVADAAEHSQGTERHVQSLEQLKAIALAVANYETVFGSFPNDITAADGTPLLSWRVRLLPLLNSEGLDLYEQFHLDEPWDSPHNLTLLPLIPDEFAIVIEDDRAEVLREGVELARRIEEQTQADEPLAIDQSMESLQLEFTRRMIEYLTREPAMSQDEPTRSEETFSFRVDKSKPVTFYQGFSGPGTFFEPGKDLRFNDIPDGTAETVMFVEADASVPWTRPGGLSLEDEPKVGGLGFGEGFGVAFADGSVQFLDRDIPAEKLRAMATRNGAEPIE